jgi:DNA-directed RNA polymerase beta' subunit
MKLKIINIDEIAASLPEITNPKIDENRKFSKDGLFSQQIFGPIKSYHCICSKNSYKGPRYNEKKCPICGVDITTAEVRKKRFAKIELPFIVLNPIFFHMFCQNRTTMKKMINDMLYYAYIFYYDDNGEINKIGFEDEGVIEIDEESKLIGLSGVVKYMTTELRKYDGVDDDKVKDYIKYLRNNLDKITIKNVIVIPPDFRPAGQNSAKKYVVDDVNDVYNRIIKISNELKHIPYELSEGEEIYRTNFRYLQKLIIELTEFVFERMSKKSGLI